MMGAQGTQCVAAAKRLCWDEYGGIQAAARAWNGPITLGAAWRLRLLRWRAGAPHKMPLKEAGSCSRRSFTPSRKACGRGGGRGGFGQSQALGSSCMVPPVPLGAPISGLAYTTAPQARRAPAAAAAAAVPQSCPRTLRTATQG